MKTHFLPLLLVVFMTSIIQQSFAQKSDRWVEPPIEFTRQFQEKTFRPEVPTGSLRGYDWSAAVDSIWGMGASTDSKLATFDNYWNTIDQSFACFQDIEDKWDALRDLYRPEIEQGVSLGRMAAIMDQLSVSLRESHTAISHVAVHQNTFQSPGVPLMSVGGWGENRRFGAGLTPLEDSSLLVYQVVPNHPLGLVLGDRVLGYDGIEWKDCYKDLIQAEIPISGFWWGSSPSSFDHSFMMAAGLNWHLFDTIDIVKFESGDTLHLSTTPLNTVMPSLFCSEQMDLPGIPKPNINAQELFTYGIVEGTNIGYIYGWGWFWEAEAEFLEAVETLMNDYDPDGIIIDFRMNYGGNMFLSDLGLDLLFPYALSTIDFAGRCGPDHLDMCAFNIGFTYNIGQAPDGYEKPIALLVGPGAISSGDQVALRVQFHPNARTFGKSTSTAFNAPTNLLFDNSSWNGRFAETDAYLMSVPGDYLTHNEFHVDEEVWLTPESVVEGEDDVVNAAIDWINSLTTSVDEEQEDQQLDIFPNPASEEIRLTAKGLTGTNGWGEIFNQQGQLVEQLSLESDKNISIAHLPSGLYYLRVPAKDGVYAGSFVKQ